MNTGAVDHYGVPFMRAINLRELDLSQFARPALNAVGVSRQAASAHSASAIGGKPDFILQLQSGRDTVDLYGQRSDPLKRIVTQLKQQRASS
jgi:hypothetical protein